MKILVIVKSYRVKSKFCNKIVSIKFNYINRLFRKQKTENQLKRKGVI